MDTGTFSLKIFYSFCGLVFNSDHENIETVLQNFSELEKISLDRLLSKGEELCQTHFKTKNA